MNQIKRKQEKAKKRRKEYERKRNLAKAVRQKMRREGMPVKIKRKNKVFCNECAYSRKNKKSQIDCYYCGLYDRDAYNQDELWAWGKFKGNRTGDCNYFKRVNLLTLLWRKLFGKTKEGS